MIPVDIFMAAILGLSLAILIVVTLISRMSTKRYQTEDKTVIEIIKLRNNWLGGSIVCLFMHYWCILYSILLTLIVLYLSCFEDTATPQIKVRVVLYSAVSLFINVLPYVINLKKISNKYRNAYIELIPTLNTLIYGYHFADAIEQGENEISQAFID